MRLTLSEAIERYGSIENGIWLAETRWCIRIEVPLEIAWINTAMGTVGHHVYCNRDIAVPLQNAFKKIIQAGLSSELKTFDGCLMIRDVRGEPGKPSTHSYGCAIDINAATNPLGSEGDLSDDLAKCFTEEGFTWGKTFKRHDPQHFSCAWE